MWIETLDLALNGLAIGSRSPRACGLKPGGNRPTPARLVVTLPASVWIETHITSTNPKETSVTLPASVWIETYLALAMLFSVIVTLPASVWIETRPVILPCAPSASHAPRERVD